MVVFDRKEDYRFKKWSYLIKQRDDWTCRICKRRGIELHAHHIFAWNKYPDLRFEFFNGVTLCRQHHELFHQLYGYGGNDAIQFHEYIETSNVMIDDINKKIKLKNLANKIIKDLEIRYIAEDLEQKVKDGYFIE